MSIRCNANCEFASVSSVSATCFSNAMKCILGVLSLVAMWPSVGLTQG